MQFPEAIAAQIAGSVVRCDVLVEFDFSTGTKRLWNGFGALVTNDARAWDGVGGLGSVTGLEQTINGSAPEMAFTVSGVDETFAARVKGDRDNWYGRAVKVYLQFFDDDWQCLDSPFAVSYGKISKMSARRQSTDEGFVYTVSISAEGPFIGRKRSRYGFYTDQDQQGRSSGDKFCERVIGIENKIVNFPAAG